LWLAKLPPNGGGLHTNASLGFFEYEAISMKPERCAKAATHIVNVLPALKRFCSKRGPEPLSRPAGETLDSLVGLAVRGSFGDVLAISGSGPERREAELHFESSPRGEELLMIPRWRMDAEGLWVDLVDGHVDVFVILVVVPNGDVLVLGEAQSTHEVLHNLAELFHFEASILRVK
jgi:hypothetical protein